MSNLIILKFVSYSLFCLLLVLLACSDENKIINDQYYWGWSKLGTGLDSTVNCMITYQDKLIVGGVFRKAGNNDAICIASWDGSEWENVGSGVNSFSPGASSIFDFTIYNNQLIVGGAFDSIGGVHADNIACWDGLKWDSLSGEIGTHGDYIKCLTVYEDKLIAAGRFYTINSDTVNNIASWNGVSWTHLGEGLNGVIYDLLVYNNFLIAAGNFSEVGITSQHNIAMWDGSNWTALGNGLDKTVNCLYVFNDTLLASGDFSEPDTSSIYKIQAWNGISWVNYATVGGYGLQIYCLINYDNKLVVGGRFDLAYNDTTVKSIAIREDSVWSSLGEGFPYSRVNTLTVYKDSLVAGGNIQVVYNDFNNIAQWSLKKFDY